MRCVVYLITLYLYCDDRQHFYRDPIELIEATPCSSLR